MAKGTGFSVDCSCGRTIEVKIADAGREIRCSCGTLNHVPALSGLRRNAGMPSYKIGIADRIIQKYNDGQLPLETNCVHCGMPTENTVVCSVECERTRANGGGLWSNVFLLMLAPVWAWQQARKDFNDTEAVGREIVVNAPLRICVKCQSEIKKIDKDRTLRNLLRKIPLYGELLCEYPQAAIHLVRK
jgi:hypothetical protein